MNYQYFKVLFNFYFQTNESLCLYQQLQIFSNIISLHERFLTFLAQHVCWKTLTPKTEVRMCLHDKHSHHDRAPHISSSDCGKEHSDNFSLLKWSFPTGRRKWRICFLLIKSDTPFRSFNIYTWPSKDIVSLLSEAVDGYYSAVCHRKHRSCFCPGREIDGLEFTWNFVFCAEQCLHRIMKNHQHNVNYFIFFSSVLSTFTLKWMTTHHQH